MVANLFLTFAAIFQHANIRTPRWLGYIIQRPESHGVHHERGVHYYNYCDLPLWDIAFGTFRNPQTFTGKCGYYDGASSRVGEMFIGRDVTRAAARAWPCRRIRIACTWRSGGKGGVMMGALR